jgi:hypothetical protein
VARVVAARQTEWIVKNTSGKLRSSGKATVGALSVAVACTLTLACDGQPQRSADTILRGDGPGGRLLDLGSSDGRSTPTGDASVPITLKPTNILNNGGFEYGLQCYGNWVWSKTGEDYKGDYDFVLASDAHSGSYSVEIRCQGADCLKAAIISQRIPTSPSRAYKLQLYAKCPSGTSSQMSVTDTTAGEEVHDVTCNDQWTPTEVSFTTSSAASSFTLYVYNASTQWLRIDDLLLTYADGTVPPQTIRHPGLRQSQVSGQRVLVDGAPYLALGFYDVPYEDLKEMADLGGNTLAGFGANGYVHHDCFNTEQQSFLDRAHELGIGVLPDSTSSARLDAPEIFPAILERFGPHLANIAWYLDDEPDSAVSWYQVKPATLIAEYKSAKTKTSLPQLVDFQRADWGTTADISPYAGSFDIWMAEPYGTDFTGVAAAVDNFNAIAPHPIWLAQDDVPASYVMPKAYYAIAKGVTGILYFSWPAFKKDAAKLDAAKQAFGELASLKDAIFSPGAAGVSGPSGVSFIARQYQGQTHVLAVNPTSQSIQGSFSVAGLAAGKQVSVLFESRTITTESGQFSDSFDGVSRHVYRIE